jgi:hypothetical protein
MDICTVIFCSRLLYDLAMMNDFHDIDERGTLEVKDQRAGCYQAQKSCYQAQKSRPPFARWPHLSQSEQRSVTIMFWIETEHEPKWSAYLVLIAK